MRITQTIVAWLILVGVVAQFYFVGLAVFGAADFTLHAVTGTFLIPVALVQLALIGFPRATRSMLGLAAANFVMLFLQPVLALVPRVDAPAVSALHPLVALGILFASIRLVQRLRALSSASGPS